LNAPCPWARFPEKENVKKLNNVSAAVLAIGFIRIWLKRFKISEGFI
jgi:hypothetical protein